MPGKRYSLEVRPRVPESLSALKTLANDLLFSWDRDTRGLFWRLDEDLWESVNHNPKVFLRRISQAKLEAAAKDRIFMEDYERVLQKYENYHSNVLVPEVAGKLDPETDLIAYFCAEFGFTEAVPLYSGGLGILAGDHCKAASDMRLPFVAVGLLYRQGYFSQRIDGHGHQVVQYRPTDFADLPIEPAFDAHGQEIHITAPIEGRDVHARVWLAKAGHITVCLLDTDIPDNNETDRGLTFQLYGGDIETRIKQEILLGIGGVRALQALNLEPSVWHINEGHAAFQLLERCFAHVNDGLDFDSAMELTAGGTVFTTHTPVAAGHDRFHHTLMDRYLGPYIDRMGIGRQHVYDLGKSPEDDQFNMTALALRMSRFQNGVSRIHGRVASEMEHYVWPEVPPAENPVGHVTNGIHVPTFLAREWANLFHSQFRDWREQLRNPAYWEKAIDEIADHRYWSLRQSLKTELLQDVHRRVKRQQRRNGASEALVKRMCAQISHPDSDVLVIGFARRFATYKRATLLLSDPDRLARIISDPKRPVLLIFAGKAHPRDEPGQELIRRIHQLTQDPRFLGHILLLEGYDLALARKLVTGCDVWLNTPVYPMEASGTSGQKAAINGGINLSVLDGWWGEGYNGDNGWAITPHGREFDAHDRDFEEASDLLDILEKQVLPLYYDRNSNGFSRDWVEMSKASMKSILPEFNAERMVMDYIDRYYLPAIRQHRRMSVDNGAPARELARWKTKIRENWGGVHAERADDSPNAIFADEALTIQVRAHLNGLEPGDVAVECRLGRCSAEETFEPEHSYRLEPTTRLDNGNWIFSLTLKPELSGLQFYQLRLFPWHEHLCHPLEMGRMIWL